jgi:uncharacterized protein (UPF0264 family)
MKLLVSPKNLGESIIAVQGGADIIDIKNPLEGSLGANYPWVIKKIKESLPKSLELSATMGDFDNRPGFASLAARGLSNLDVTYIKVGLFIKSFKHSLELAESIVKATKNSGSRVVLAGYADYSKIGTIDPGKLPKTAILSGAEGVMIDTYQKNGNTIFEHLEMPDLYSFVKDSKDIGLITALAGSVKKEHIPRLKRLDPDIIGVRGAVCTNTDRLRGKIEKEKVKEFKKLLI